MFSARMRLRGSDRLKERKVDKLIRDLQLTHCQDTYIGSQLVKGISGGERKRACIGVELVADPIVLILDGIYVTPLFIRTHLGTRFVHSLHHHEYPQGPRQERIEMHHLFNTYSKLRYLHPN